MRTGRRWLFGVIAVGFVFSCAEILYFVVSGSLSFSVEGGGKEALEFVVASYGPALGIMAAHYFSEHAANSKRKTPRPEAFVFALAIAALNALATPFVIWVLSPTALAIDWLRSFAAYNQPLLAAALTYYFASAAVTADASAGHSERGSKSR